MFCPFFTNFDELATLQPDRMMVPTVRQPVPVKQTHLRYHGQACA